MTEGGVVIVTDGLSRPEKGSGDVLLQTHDVGRTYPVRGGAGLLTRSANRPRLHAVTGVDVTVRRGRTLGVVGETGSGKSTLGRLALGLERPTTGSVTYRGHDLQAMNTREERAFRSDVQVVLQDPYSSINPYRNVEQTLGEVLRVHGMKSRAERSARIDDVMERVGLPVSWRDRRPGQLSGGGRQRVSIARALAVEPRLIVADEPVSALDVSVQAQVLNLFADLQENLGLAYLFITHDLAVLAHLADEVAVMYLGRVVEQGPAADVLTSPSHPYTQSLLAAAPTLGRRRSTRPAADGELPDPVHPPAGCAFHTRCPFVMDVCRTEKPVPVGVPAFAGSLVAGSSVTGPSAAVSSGHVASCHLLDRTSVPAP